MGFVITVETRVAAERSRSASRSYKIGYRKDSPENWIFKRSSEGGLAT